MADINQMRDQYNAARKAMQKSFKEHTIKMLAIEGANSAEIASIIGERPRSVRSTLLRLNREGK